MVLFKRKERVHPVLSSGSSVAKPVGGEKTPSSKPKADAKKSAGTAAKAKTATKKLYFLRMPYSRSGVGKHWHLDVLPC